MLENLLCLTIDKCNALEEALRLCCNQFESLNIKQTSQPSSPLKTLVDVCSELHEKEATCVEKDTQSTQTDNSRIKEENQIKKEDIYDEHKACFYCDAHSKYYDDQKLPILHSAHQCEEYKGNLV